MYIWRSRLCWLSRGTGSNRKIDYVYDEVALEQKLNEKINERKAAGVKIDENAEKFKTGRLHGAAAI